MSDEKTGGPAFPRLTRDAFQPEYTGMSLRDYFAAEAMKVCLSQCDKFPDENWRIGIAMDAYMMADAMLEVRNK